MVFVCNQSTVWLQISMVEYFLDFREFHYDHENFCHEIFLTAAHSTGLDTLNHEKPMNHENQARSRKFGYNNAGVRRH